jgi:adenosylmethionine-8-amino-7-oxononanoate aminotransferase
MRCSIRVWRGDEKMDSRLIMHRTSKVEWQESPVMVRGEGVWLYDEKGRRYLDLTAGNTRPVHIGYGREEVARAAYEQMVRLTYMTPMQYRNEPSLALAKKLGEIAPGKIEWFTFVCDGSEAVEAAIKLARHYNYFNGEKRRYKIISRRGAYHGVTNGALRALGSVLPMRHMMEPLGPGVIFAESPYCFRCPLHLSYPACDLACARDIERLIEFEDPEQISVFLGEPIQQAFGAYAPPKEYWPLVAEICRNYGILLIDDEVICGFGRTGKWFGIEHFQVEPDLMTMAKGISSGYLPLGAVGCTEEVVGPIETFYHLHTYANHPVSCAAALKNLEIMERERLVERSRKIGEFFLDALKELEEHGLVGEARGTGLWLALDLTADKKTRSPLPQERISRIVRRARDKGVIIRAMGSALEFAPALTIGEEEIEEGVRIVKEVLEEEEKRGRS